MASSGGGNRRRGSSNHNLVPCLPVDQVLNKNPFIVRISSRGQSRPGRAVRLPVNVECPSNMDRLPPVRILLRACSHNSALESQTKLEESVKQLEKEVSLFGKEQKQLIKLTEQKVKKCVASEKKEKELMEKAMNALQDVTVEIESSAADRKRLAEQITQADATIAELKDEVENAENEVALKKSAYEELQVSLDEKQKELSKCDKQSAQISNEMDDFQAEISNIGVER